MQYKHQFNQKLKKTFCDKIGKIKKNFFFIFPSFFGIQILGFLFELAYSIKQEYFNKVHISKP